jgi:hypothetical protein
LPFVAVRSGEVPVERATSALRKLDRDFSVVSSAESDADSPRSVVTTAESVAFRSPLPSTVRSTFCWMGIGRLADGVTGRGWAARPEIPSRMLSELDMVTGDMKVGESLELSLAQQRVLGDLLSGLEI